MFLRKEKWPKLDNSRKTEIFNYKWLPLVTSDILIY